MLMVTDGTHTAYLKFDDFTGTFKFGSDDGGGTDIYDPPAADSKDAPSTATTTTTSKTSAGSDHTAAPAPGTPSTPATGSFGIVGNDSFTFHPNLGGDTAQNTGTHTVEFAHSTPQVVAPALASIAPEFHQEFAFNTIHQDVASYARKLVTV